MTCLITHTNRSLMLPFGWSNREFPLHSAEPSSSLLFIKYKTPLSIVTIWFPDFDFSAHWLTLIKSHSDMGPNEEQCRLSTQISLKYLFFYIAYTDQLDHFGDLQFRENTCPAYCWRIRLNSASKQIFLVFSERHRPKMFVHVLYVCIF